MNEQEVIGRFKSELERRLPDLGPRYELLSQSQWLGQNLKEVPDLVVHDKNRDNYLVIEVKHYEQPRPLTLSAVPIARKIKIGNESVKIDVAILTNSEISEPLKIGLERERIPVIKYSTTDQAVENLIAFISEKYKQ